MFAVSVDVSFSDRWACFYCEKPLSSRELRAAFVCCRSCHQTRLHGGKKPRVLVTTRVIPVDVTRRAYISIPDASHTCLKGVNVPVDAHDVYIHVLNVRNGVAKAYITMTDPVWVAEQEELRRQAELEAGAA